jgi:hypothetical protein
MAMSVSNVVIIQDHILALILCTLKDRKFAVGKWNWGNSILSKTVTYRILVIYLDYMKRCLQIDV